MQLTGSDRYIYAKMNVLVGANIEQQKNSSAYTLPLNEGNLLFPIRKNSRDIFVMFDDIFVMFDDIFVIFDEILAIFLSCLMKFSRYFCQIIKYIPPPRAMRGG